MKAKADPPREAYLKWLDKRIAEAVHHGGLSSDTRRVLMAARKAFADEFYPK
jgi:hypothetical protein